MNKNGDMPVKVAMKIEIGYKVGPSVWQRYRSNLIGVNRIDSEKGKVIDKRGANRSNYLLPCPPSSRE